MFEKWILQAGVGLLVAYLVIKEVLSFLKNRSDDPAQSMTIEEHERLCPRKDLWEKLSKIYEIVLEIKGKIDGKK